MRAAKLISYVLTASLLALTTLAQAKLDPAGLKRGLDSICPEEAYVLCQTLASPEFAGRLTGHQGYTAAARWAALKFKEWGLRPLGAKEGYLQSFPSPHTLIDRAEMTLLLPEKTAEGQAQVKELKLEPAKVEA